jgi:GDPmannose 4,6-dehydratase
MAGQDGLYMAEHLLKYGKSVIGLVRDRDRAIASLPPEISSRVQLIEFDMHNQHIMEDLIRHYEPSEIYNFAAYSSGTGMYVDPIGMGEVNGLAVVRILEAIRKINCEIRFCQASSREIFGEPAESPQTELTPANPRSPYGAAKLYADSMIRIYRQRYGLFACSAILFNHESPHRGLAFVTRTITHGAARIKVGLASELRLGNLDAQRDWGFAGDYVRAMWLMLQRQCAEDYVIATGEVHSVREVCEIAFTRLGLDYRNYVREDTSAFRPAEPAPLVGSASKARRDLGWKPEVAFEDLVLMMVDSDMRQLSVALRN